MWTPETEAQALGILHDITVDAPGFGPAHAELAGLLNIRHIMLPGTTQTEDVKQRAMLHATEAIALDPLDTRAHRVLAWCSCHKREFALSEFHFEQALTLNGDNALTLASCALGFAFMGDAARARALAGRVAPLGKDADPYLNVYLAATDYLGGDYARAAERCQVSGGLMSTVGGWHCAALVQTGQHARARQRRGAFCDEIRQIWRGPRNPGDDDILDWFVSVFPLRHEATRRTLRATLARAGATGAA